MYKYIGMRYIGGEGAKGMQVHKSLKGAIPGPLRGAAIDWGAISASMGKEGAVGISNV